MKYIYYKADKGRSRRGMAFVQEHGFSELMKLDPPKREVQTSSERTGA